MVPFVDLVRAMTVGPLTTESPDGVVAWWQLHRARQAAYDAPFDRALMGGLWADRVGYAFAAGYREALAVLVPGVASSGLAVLAATEEQGARPSAVRSTLTRGADGQLRLNGHKRWATLATIVDVLLVVASEGVDERGRNRLRLCRIDRARAGVEVRPMPAPPFAPEIPHAEIAFHDVLVDPSDVLPGDGWDAYVKPFRTVEDLYVHTALLGYLAGFTRRSSFPDDLLEEILVTVAALRELSKEPPSAAETHVALAGALSGAKRIIGRVEELLATTTAPAGNEAERERWVRDRPLFGVAGSARAQRREVAWQRLRAPSDASR